MEKDDIQILLTKEQKDFMETSFSKMSYDGLDYYICPFIFVTQNGKTFVPKKLKDIPYPVSDMILEVAHRAEIKKKTGK